MFISIEYYVNGPLFREALVSVDQIVAYTEITYHGRGGFKDEHSATLYMSQGPEYKLTAYSSKQVYDLLIGKRAR